MGRPVVSVAHAAVRRGGADPAAALTRQRAARARWRRCFALSLDLRRLARSAAREGRCEARVIDPSPFAKTAGRAGALLPLSRPCWLPGPDSNQRPSG